MQEQDKNKVMANTKIKQIRETKSLNPIWTGGWGWGKRLLIVFRPSPKEMNGKSAQLLLLFIIMNIKRSELHFASIYWLL